MEYYKWLPVDQYSEDLTVATNMDPLMRLPSDMSLYLRLNVLLWGKLLIPEIFLLHNRHLKNYLTDRKNKKDIEEFFDIEAAIISRNDHSWNTCFEAHWHESKKTNNPLLIPGEEGRIFARYLDHVVNDSHCRRYATNKRAIAFEALFFQSLNQMYKDYVYREESLNMIASFFRQNAIAHGDRETRQLVDGFSGLSRGRVKHGIEMMRKEPKMIPLIPIIEEASRQAYARNVLASLNRNVENSANVPLLYSSQFENELGYGMKFDHEIAHDFGRMLNSQPRLYKIDVEAIKGASWDLIHKIASHPMRAGFQKRRTLALHAESTGNQDKYREHAEKMIDHLDEYLLHVSQKLKSSEYNLRVFCEKMREGTVTYTLNVCIVDPIVNTITALAFSTAREFTKERKMRKRKQKLAYYLIGDKCTLK